MHYKTQMDTAVLVRPPILYKSSSMLYSLLSLDLTWQQSQRVYPCFQRPPVSDVSRLYTVLYNCTFCVPDQGQMLDVW